MMPVADLQILIFPDADPEFSFLKMMTTPVRTPKYIMFEYTLPDAAFQPGFPNWTRKGEKEAVPGPKVKKSAVLNLTNPVSRCILHFNFLRLKP